jgi:radical SAM protein with 4Fe4S-binding SPASM domain
LDGLVECGVQTLTLTGGEPMLHPRFMDIVREIHKRGLTLLDVTTNASLVSAQMLDEFSELGVKPKFKVSFDGLGHHDWLRGTDGAEETTLSAIKLLTEKGFSVRIQMNLHKGNLDCVLPTVKFLAEMGIDDIRFMRTTEVPRWQENGAGLTLSVEEYYELALELSEKMLFEDINIDVTFWQILSYYPKAKSFNIAPLGFGCGKKYRDSLPTCRAVRGRLAITADGELFPCNQLSGLMKKRGVSFGNVKKNSIREIITSGEYLDVAAFTVGERLRYNPKCQTCGHYKNCGGGCPALAALLGEGLRGYDPTKCVFFEGGYMEKTTELFERFGYRLGDLPIDN